LSIINSIVFGIGTLPEAKIGPVKRMPKREMDSCRLYVSMKTGISLINGSYAEWSSMF
jgi:hypothetical protein